MYSREERNKAIELYIKYDYCIADVKRELGYPNYRTLKKWYTEYQQDIIEDKENSPCIKKSKYNQEQQKRR